LVKIIRLNQDKETIIDDINWACARERLSPIELDKLIQRILTRPLPETEPVEPDTPYEADESPVEDDTTTDEEE
jgi:hypothetical protein